MKCRKNSRKNSFNIKYTKNCLELQKLKMKFYQFLNNKALHPYSKLAIFNDIISMILTIFWMFIFSINICF